MLWRQVAVVHEAEPDRLVAADVVPDAAAPNQFAQGVMEADDRGDGLAAGIYFYEVTVDQHSTCKSWLQLVK